MLEDKFYVYQHRRNDTNEIFYVGKGHGNRAYWIYGRSKYWNNIVNKVGYTVEIIESELSEFIALQREIKLIKSIGRKDLKLGSLINMTDGGDGQSGLNHTQESRDKISKAHIGRAKSQKTRDKMSANKKGKLPPNIKLVAVNKFITNDLGEVFESLTTAASVYNIVNIGNITLCCQGKRRSAGGRKWQYYIED